MLLKNWNVKTILYLWGCKLISVRTWVTWAKFHMRDFAIMLKTSYS